MIDFNTILPHEIIQIGGIILLVWIIGGLIFNLIRWRPVLNSYFTGTNKTKNITLFFRNFSLIILRDILLQNNLWRCNVLKWFSHFLVFWGFLILGMSTTLNYLMNPLALPLPLTHLVRILGNTGGIMFMIGLIVMLSDRLLVRGVRQNTSFGDAFFIALLFTASFSGFLTEIFSEINSVQLTFAVYWTHLVTVVALFLLIPYSKFIHFLGRSLILLLENLGDEARAFDNGD